MSDHLVTFCQSVRRGYAWAIRHPRMTLIGLNALALLIAGWLLTRPGARFGPQDGTWIRVQINKDLYVGLDPDYPPFTQWTPDQIDGLEADLAREIGNRLGVKTQILIMGSDSLYDSLYTGYVDMLISGLHVDPTQAYWVHYTPPYYDAGQILVSRAESPVENIRDMDGKTIAVEIASAGDLAARRWERRLHALDILRYMLPNDAMQAVQQGQAYAALVDTISARLYLKDHTDLVMAPKTTVPDGYVIALRKGNFRLVEAVERALDDMRADGTLDTIIARWL
jgi:ABC-type amino acid transport substrate-binding protein